MLVLFSYAFLVPTGGKHAHRRHSLPEPARAAASVRMEAQTIMEMPMPKELADWGVPATAQIRRTLTSFVRYAAPL